MARASGVLSGVGSLNCGVSAHTNVAMKVTSVLMLRSGTRVLRETRGGISGVAGRFHHNLVASSRECGDIVAA